MVQQLAASSEWPLAVLGEVCEIVMGQSPPSSTYRTEAEGLPFFQGNADFGIISPTVRVWCVAPLRIAQTGDVLVSVRAPVGAVNMADRECCIGRGLAALRSNTDRLLHEFLALWIKSQRAFLEAVSTGTTFQSINRKTLSNLEIPLPPLEAQQLLVPVMQLIENNRRRIQLLEQAARLLYKEWFVHLRFPGHEHVKIKDGVPEGWEKKPLSEVALLNYGRSLKKDDRLPGSVPVYGSSGIVGTHNQATVNGPTIIIGRKGNVGSVYWSSEDCVPIDTVYYVQSESCSLRLYYALRTLPFISTDVAVPGLNRDFAHSRLILTPSSSYHRLFENTVGPFHQQIAILRRQNAKLERALDLLLPRLMSGEVWGKKLCPASSTRLSAPC